MFQESENLQWRIRQAFGEFDDDGLSVVELAYAIAGRLKDSLSQHSGEVAILRSKIDTMHRLMVTAEKRGASQEAKPVASSQPTELEMHRADYNAIKAAGFDSPGELLAAYNTLQAYTGRDLNQFIEDEADRHAWFMGGAENVVCVSDLRQWMAGHARVSVETMKDAERYVWLKNHAGEQPTQRSLMNESSEHKTEFIFPRLIAWADFCGPITLDEAIDFKLTASKERTESIEASQEGV